MLMLYNYDVIIYVHFKIFNKVHRVVVPEEEIRRRTPRQSIAFFVHPDNDVMIAPLDGSGKHEPVDALTYVKSRLIASSYK